MILTTLRLHPFAGTPDRTLRFEPGLNLILGDNDIGKSTLFKALEAVLFIPPNPGKNTVEGKKLQTSIPIRGDHARVTLGFRTQAGDWVLEKTWGSRNPSASLTRPTGGTLTDPTLIDSEIATLLSASPATTRLLLLARQGELLETLSLAGSTPAVNEDLGNLLRETLKTGGGISVERLKKALEEEYKTLTQRWEVKLNQPEGGRGIDNPWSKGVGTILENYYELEKLERARKRVLDLEDQQARLGSQLAASKSRQEDLQQFISKGQAAYDAEGIRELLQGKVTGFEANLTRQKQNVTQWMQANLSLEDAGPKLAQLDLKLKELEQELALSSQSRMNAVLQEQYRKVKFKASETSDQKALIERLPRIEEATVHSALNLERKLETLRARLSAGKLVARIQAKTEGKIGITSGLKGTPEAWSTKTGEERTFTGEGMLRIETESFLLDVASGDQDLLELPATITRSETELATLLSSYGAKEPGALQQMLRERTAASQTLSRMEAELKTLLGSETLETLEAKATSSESAVVARETSVVQREFNSTLSEKQALEKKFQAASIFIDSVKAESGCADPEALMMKSMEQNQELVGLKGELAALPPIPEGMGSATDFKRRFQDARNELPRVTEEVRENTRKKAEIAFPEESAEDLGRQAAEARRTLNGLIQRARGLLRVLIAIDQVDQDPAAIYRDLESGFARSLTELTGGKYGHTQPLIAPASTKAEPALTRNDAVEIPYSLLSAGMKDAVALAYRLTLAGFLLEKKPGFVLVDDPLVNLDPERQKIAAKMVREFAERSQLLFFTCHDSHRVLLSQAFVVKL